MPAGEPKVPNQTWLVFLRFGRRTLFCVETPEESACTTFVVAFVTRGGNSKRGCVDVITSHSAVFVSPGRPMNQSAPESSLTHVALPNHLLRMQTVGHTLVLWWAVPAVQRIPQKWVPRATEHPLRP